MASVHDPDVAFDPTGKPTISSGDIENGALAEAGYLLDADAWQVQLMYGGPCNASIFVDDVLETYREIKFLSPAFVDRVFVGVVATGSGDVTIKSSVSGTDYENAISVNNAFEDSLADSALANASVHWQSSDTPQIVSDNGEVTTIRSLQIKRASTVRVFGIVLKWSRSRAGL